MRHAGCWRSILTKRHGSKMLLRFSRPAANSTCQRHWNAHAQETVAMCGYSLSEQSLRQPRENLAVQSSPEPWNLTTSLGWIHMTDYSPTRTRCPRAGLATSLPFRCKSLRAQTGTAFSLMENSVHIRINGSFWQVLRECPPTPSKP